MEFVGHHYGGRFVSQSRNMTSYNKPRYRGNLLQNRHWKCTICSSIYHSHRKFKEHLNISKHYIDSQTYNKMKCARDVSQNRSCWECSVCLNTFAFKKDLQRHIETSKHYKKFSTGIRFSKHSSIHTSGNHVKWKEDLVHFPKDKQHCSEMANKENNDINVFSNKPN